MWKTATSLILPLLALLAGVSAVTQATLNARLRSGLASWSWAAFTSYSVGTVAILIVIFVQRAPRPSITMVAAVPWWAWAGGYLGVVYIVLSIVLLQRLGASTVMAFVVAGQMLGALAFDQFGLMGLERLPAAPLRLAGALLLVGGVVLMRI